jgi:hypothetical protein
VIRLWHRYILGHRMIGPREELFASLSSVIAMRLVTSATAALIFSAARCAVAGTGEVVIAAVEDGVAGLAFAPPPWSVPQATTQLAATAKKLNVFRTRGIMLRS